MKKVLAFFSGICCLFWMVVLMIWTVNNDWDAAVKLALTMGAVVILLAGGVILIAYSFEKEEKDELL